MKTYTDPKLLDVHGALDALPALPLLSSELACTNGENQLAPPLAPTAGFLVQAVSIPDKI